MVDLVEYLQFSHDIALHPSEQQKATSITNPVGHQPLAPPGLIPAR